MTVRLREGIRKWTGKLEGTGMKSLTRIACVHAQAVDIDDDNAAEICEAGAGHEASSRATTRPAVAFPATFAFQLNRQASFFRKSSFHSL